MKRHMMFFVVAVCCMSLAACSNRPPEMGVTTYELGQDALQIVDQYIDKELSTAQAGRQLQILSESMENVQRKSDEESTLISTSVLVHVMLLRDTIIDDGPDSIVLEYRNRLANLLKKN